MRSRGNGVGGGYHKDYNQNQDSPISGDNITANTEAGVRDKGLTIDEDNLKLLELLRDCPNRHNDSHNRYNYNDRHYDSNRTDPRSSGPYENDEIEQNIYELENVVINHPNTKPVIRPNSLKARKPAKLVVSNNMSSEYDGNSENPAKVVGNRHRTVDDRKSGNSDDVEISDGHDAANTTGDNDWRALHSNSGTQANSGDVLTSSLSKYVALTSFQMKP